MKVPDLYVGKQLHVGIAVPPAIALGVGPLRIRGSAYIEGPMLVGTTLSYQIPEANLMVSRCANLEALPPPISIFKVSTRGLAPTPLDVMLGDPTGHVGITVNSLVISIFNDTRISIISPFTTGVGQLSWVGNVSFVGNFSVKGNQSNVGNLSVIGAVTALQVTASGVTLTSRKPFDIPHPTKEGWRLRHVCLEGPESGVYYRGRIVNSNIIELPEYWKNLIDTQSITVSLTPIGAYQDVIVKRWDESKIYLQSKGGMPVDCFYHIFAERKDGEKLIVEYEGKSIEDYPGDNSIYSINK
jgi:hypothetical protein